MAIKTIIQWCDSTVNPVMGCEGCEMWPTHTSIRKAVVTHLEKTETLTVNRQCYESVDEILRKSGGLPTDIYHRRHNVAEAIIKNCIKTYTDK